MFIIKDMLFQQLLFTAYLEAGLWSLLAPMTLAALNSLFAPKITFKTDFS